MNLQELEAQREEKENSVTECELWFIDGKVSYKGVFIYCYNKAKIKSNSLS